MNQFWSHSTRFGHNKPFWVTIYPFLFIFIHILHEFLFNWTFFFWGGGGGGGRGVMGHTKLVYITHCTSLCQTGTVLVKLNQFLSHWINFKCPYFCTSHAVTLVNRFVSCGVNANPLGEPRGGELRTQKLKSHLVRTQSLNVLPFKPGVGQYIAIHATLTAREFFLVYFYPSSPLTCIFSKTSPNLFLCWPAE